MSLMELILIAVGLSMDAFAVAITDGMLIKRRCRAVFTAVMFGLFQGIMPLLGFLLGAAFAQLIGAYDHYIALLVLGFIGVKMMIESARELRRGGEEDTPVREPNAAAILAQAVATSIDALIVGVSFAAVGVEIVSAASVIAAVTFAISLAGVFGGRRLGRLFGAKATLFGGAVLVVIGIKTFVQHVFF